MSHQFGPMPTAAGQILWIGHDQSDAGKAAEPLLCALTAAGSLEAGLLRFGNEAFDAIAVTGMAGDDCEALAEAVRGRGSGVPLVFRLAGLDVRLSARL